MAGECLANACQAWVVTNEGQETATTSNRFYPDARFVTDTEDGLTIKTYVGTVRRLGGDGWELVREVSKSEWLTFPPKEVRWTEATFRRPCEPRGYCSAFHKET